MFDWLRKLFHLEKAQRESKEPPKQDTPLTPTEIEDVKIARRELEAGKGKSFNFVEEMLRELKEPEAKNSFIDLEAAKREMEKLQEQELEATKEQLARDQWLPKPPTHRRTQTHSYQPPAEQHRDAISKHMKRVPTSARYRKTAMQSKNIKIEEED